MEITPERVEQILKIAQEPVSLETPVGDEDDSARSATSSRTTSMPRPHLAVDSKLRREESAGVLSSLSHRERKVLELRYGLDGERAR